MSLKIKLTLAFLFVSLAGILLVAILAAVITTREFGNFVDAQDRTLMANELAQYYEENGGWENLIPNNGRPFRMGTQNGRFFILADAEGKAVMPGNGFRPNQSIPPELLARGEPIMVDGVQVGTLLPLPQQGRGQALADFSQRVNLILLIAAVGATAVSLILGFIITRNLTRPLQEMTIATQKIADGDLTQQVPVRTDDELGELATSFNQMSQQLATSREMRQQMTADIAHDLRTPLSIILGHAEALSDGVLPGSQETFDVLHDEAKRLEHLVSDLRTLSLADAGELTMTPREVSPSALLERAFIAYTQKAQQKNIEITLDVEDNLPDVFVDPDRMAQVLDNLLSNALRYTPENGRIHLSAQQNRTGIELRVQDNGPGMSVEDTQHVFDRFYRADKSRQRQNDGGSGLGLAIAKSIVLAQNGRIWAESKLGQGTTFLIRFPI